MSKMIRRSLAALAIFSLSVFSLAACDNKTGPQERYADVDYMVVVPQKDPLILETDLPGRTSAYNISEVRPQITGIIQERLFEQGDYVEQGQSLYQIDPALYQAAVDSAEASLHKARANAQAAGLLARRYREILGTKAVSKQDYDNAVAGYSQAQAEVNYAQAALDTAKINLGYTTITAPISGRIGRSTVTSGALVTQNQAQTLATIQQLNPIYVDVTQSSTDMLRLRRAYESGLLQSSGKNAAKAKLLLSDGSLYANVNDKGQLEPIFGDLLFSEVSVEQSTGSVTLRAKFPNPDGVLLPGMFVRAVVEEGAREGAILVPQKTVSRDNRGRAVVHKLLKNATLENMDGIYNVQLTQLTLGRDVDGTQWLVVDGLQAGDMIITDGRLKLQAGKAVRAATNEGASRSSNATRADQAPENAAGEKQ